MDSSVGACSEDTPELNGGVVVVDLATATDNEGPSSVGAALVVGATDEGSSAAAHEALMTSAGQCMRRRVTSALINLEEHTEALPVISSGDVPSIVSQYGRGYPNGLKSMMAFIVDSHEQVCVQHAPGPMVIKKAYTKGICVIHPGGRHTVSKEAALAAYVE
ncbi:hypothetical protein C0989_004561 [Termitomyces sp. Mn162]|nr:hypothetical protein C0989_004561 [Termitomyces sp. Mn162]